MLRTLIVAIVVSSVLWIGAPRAQECPDPRRDLCPPGLVCGVPTTKQCSCLSCATGSCDLVPKDCDDDDPCTIDGCDDLTGCHHRPLCDDGDPCTTERCIRVPVVPEVVLCSDPAPRCDDGLYCNGVETCHGDGICDSSGPRPCDDGDACTADACREDLRVCEHTLLPCDDGDPCTGDACDRRQGCTHPPVAGCCHDDASCSSGDPCDVPSCGPDQRCALLPVAGVDLLGCVCRRSRPATCATATPPRRLLRKQAKACASVAQAEATTGTDQARAIAKAGRVFGALVRAVDRPKMRKRLGACAEALGGAYRDAVDRAGQLTPAR